MTQRPSFRYDRKQETNKEIIYIKWSLFCQQLGRQIIRIFVQEIIFCLWIFSHDLAGESLRLNKAGFTLILAVILASFYIHENARKNQIHFFYTKLLSFHLQIVNNYAYLRKESAPGTSGYLVCYGAALNYLNMYNDINWTMNK